jgi:hypothetical protein
VFADLNAEDAAAFKHELERTSMKIKTNIKAGTGANGCLSRTPHPALK